MIIQNFKEIATSPKKQDALQILESGLDASMPENIFPNFLTPTKITVGKESLNIENFSNIYTVAFGKAADSMTSAVNAIITIKGGIVVIPKYARVSNFQCWSSKTKSDKCKGCKRSDKISSKQKTK